MVHDTDLIGGHGVGAMRNEEILGPAMAESREHISVKAPGLLWSSFGAAFDGCKYPLGFGRQQKLWCLCLLTY